MSELQNRAIRSLAQERDEAMDRARTAEWRLEETRGALSRAALAAAGRWTKEQPTRSGWYWVRGGCIAATHPAVAWVEVHPDPFGLTVYVDGEHRKSGSCAEWAGPIPEPVEPS